MSDKLDINIIISRKEEELKKIEEEEDKNNQAILEETSIEKLHLISTDCSFSLNQRLTALNRYFLLYPENTNDIINKLGSMYIFSSGIKVIERYLYNIALNSTLDIYLKIEASKYLSIHSEKAWECLVYILSGKEINLLSTPYRLDTIYLLMNSGFYKEEGLSFLYEVINNIDLETLFRYKSILNLEKKIENEENRRYFIINCLNKFYVNNKNDIRYIILSCQNLLSRYTNYLSQDQIKEINKTLLEISSDNNIDYNTRADSSDILLQYGTDEYKEDAKNIINFLGFGKNKTKTIFENAQNVHTKAIEESSNRTLEYLMNLHQDFKIDGDKTLEEINNFISELEKEPERSVSTTEKSLAHHCPAICTDQVCRPKNYNFKKIQISLTRISVDRSLYGSKNLTLIGILSILYNHISKSPHSNELKNRLLEELADSAGICSSGYVSRMLNVLTGFEENVGMQIGYDDQMISMLSSRLNKQMQELKDEDYMSLILEEMTISSNEYDKRPNFLKFFRENISKIREEIKADYKGILEDIDFDLYFKKAILHYEGEN